MLELLSNIYVVVTAIYVVALCLFFCGLFFPNRNLQRLQYPVSVVIAARNEEENIANILSDLIHQTYPQNKYEVLIVDDHSTDGTADVIKKFSAQHSFIKYMQATDAAGGTLIAKKNALQQGIINSTGEIIITTDADCHVMPQWIETLVSYFTDKVGMVVGFSQLGVRGEKRSIFEQLQAIDFLALLSAAHGSLNLKFPLAATGQNLAYRKKAFEQVGGFETIGHRISGDDVLLLQLINRKTDWNICFAPSPNCFNFSAPEKTFRAFLNQRKRWASNGSYQFKLNKLFFLIVLSTFLTNLFSLILAPVAIILSKYIIITMSCLAAKLVVEFLIVAKGAFSFNRIDLIKYYPLWALLQIPYVLFVGLSGNVGKFVWKGRKT